MTKQDFDKIAEDTFTDAKNLLVSSKSDEYGEEDRLIQFKEIAQMTGQIPEEALFGMWAKQIQSVRKIMRDIKRGKLPMKKILMEKTRDNMNYPVLFKGLVIERIREREGV